MRQVTARRGATREQVIAHALRLPEAWEDHPWGETVVKVRKKVFLFAGSRRRRQARARIGEIARVRRGGTRLPGARSRPGYGLGRSGWVTVPLVGVPSGLVEDWVEESYRCVAPERLTALLESGRGA